MVWNLFVSGGGIYYSQAARLSGRRVEWRNWWSGPQTDKHLHSQAAHTSRLLQQVTIFPNKQSLHSNRPTSSRPHWQGWLGWQGRLAGRTRRGDHRRDKQWMETSRIVSWAPRPTQPADPRTHQANFKYSKQIYTETRKQILVQSFMKIWTSFFTNNIKHSFIAKECTSKWEKFKFLYKVRVKKILLNQYLLRDISLMWLLSVMTLSKLQLTNLCSVPTVLFWRIFFWRTKKLIQWSTWWE